MTLALHALFLVALGYVTTVAAFARKVAALALLAVLGVLAIYDAGFAVELAVAAVALGSIFAFDEQRFHA